MFALRFILAAGSLSTLISGTPVPSPPSDLQERSANVYTVYGGTGDVSDGWPAQSAWVSSFETMFANNQATIAASCTQWSVANPSSSEIADIQSGIQSVASSTGIDARFILAIVLQESNGCVRAPTTNYGVRNPGLMQSHNGAGTCNDGSVQNPCPSSEITQMIQDGTGGTASGDGLKQCIALSGATDVSMYYKAARIYNSGSISSTKNLGAGVATHCYASDVANRLTGWTTAASTCSEGSVASLSGTVVTVGSSSSDGSASSSAVAPVVVPSSSSAAPIVVQSTTASVPQASGGVFADVGSSSQATSAVSIPVAAASPVASLVVTSQAPAPTPKSSTIAVVTTATVIPQAASTVASSATPHPTISVNDPNVGATITPGTACTQEGEWNCIDGKSFQQCGSGTWSVVMQLGAGTQCTTALADTINITAIESKPKPKSRRSMNRHIRLHKNM
ncbi:hypothetical protein G7Y89_g6050 [Cudoniella acicularis]|uniref:Transglycosylase SLT domain-containing protein n=1 Tax=Cudoniella acicularis TaxID=354080 RepID=A0A8H4RL97_9HELO|nr:hypothetical protein G7Y89_g6050 [Cudoniella acicularis]